MLGFDFVVIDQEHAPFDRGDASTSWCWPRARPTSPASCASATRARPTSSRCSTAAPPASSCRTSTAPRRRATIAAACRYRGGRRGFANTTRAGRFGEASFADHMAAQDAQVTCIAMIEDVAALDRDRRHRGGRGHRRLLHRPRRPHRGDRRAVDDLAGNAPARRADHGGGAQGRHAGHHAVARSQRRDRDGEARRHRLHGLERPRLPQAGRAPGARRIRATHRRNAS